jgi:hypothetical protein
MVDGEMGVGAAGVLARLEQRALIDQVRVDVLGQLYQHVGMDRLGRALLQPQHLAVVELQVLSGESVGLVAGVLEHLEERQEQGVVRPMAVPPERRLDRGRGLVDHPGEHGEEGLADRGEEVVGGEVVDQVDWRGARSVGVRVRREIGGGEVGPGGDAHSFEPNGRQPSPGEEVVE